MNIAKAGISALLLAGMAVAAPVMAQGQGSAAGTGASGTGTSATGTAATGPGGASTGSGATATGTAAAPATGPGSTAATADTAATTSTTSTNASTGTTAGAKVSGVATAAPNGVLLPAGYALSQPVMTGVPTVIMGGPSLQVVNAPAGVVNDPTFQRYLRLR
jgi:hypothetical protein